VKLLEAKGKEPFYFKSYDRVIGVAHDVKELASEMERLAKEDPAALEYHLREGHITAWLSYIGEARLAEALRGVSDPREAVSRVKAFLSSGGQAPSGEGGQAQGQGPQASMGPGPRGRRGRRSRRQSWPRA
jgi:hypothetical protein